MSNSPAPMLGNSIPDATTQNHVMNSESYEDCHCSAPGTGNRENTVYKDRLIYNRSSGNLVGFVDHDDINEEINRIVENSKNGGNPPVLATYMLALMIRGIFTPLSEVFAHYPCQGFTSYQLYWTIWQAV